jgi:hypothetical protein
MVRENTESLAKEQLHLDAQAKLDAEVEKVLNAADAKYNENLMSELGFDYKLSEAQVIRRERELLARFPANRIFSANAIRATCVKYGLRFLPTRFYKGHLDAGIGPAVENYRTLCGGEFLKVQAGELLESKIYATDDATVQFYIAAPASEFVLRELPRDPLLFARVSIGKFFLIHKWGDDLQTGDLRKGETDVLNWNSEYVQDRRTAQQRAADAMLRSSIARGSNMDRLRDEMMMSEGQRTALQRAVDALPMPSLGSIIGMRTVD